MMPPVSKWDLSAARDLLPALLCRLARDGGPARGVQLVWAWEVGPRLAQHAKVQRLEGDILYLQVSSAAWAHALERQEAALCARLSRRVGEPGVRGLRFVVG
jgi:predicted nucleic acid-binding Zn ribbon protein